MSLATQEFEKKWEEYRADKERRLRQAASDLHELAHPLIRDVHYYEGGHMEFNPKKGETMAPDRVQFKLERRCLSAISAISEICEGYELKVITADFLCRGDEDYEVIRLVNNKTLDEM